MAVYETFILTDPTEIAEGVEQIIEIRDIKTYETKAVKAVVSRSPEKLPGADILRVRWQRGQLLPQLYAIRIIEDQGLVGDNLGLEKWR